jgi:hypothetical protein
MTPRAPRTGPAVLLLSALTLLVVLLPGQADPPPGKETAPPPADGAEDEKFLKAAGLPTDGAGLLKFFRDRTPSTKSRDRLAALVRQLGDRSFRVREKASRELTAAGEPALEFLRAAVKNPDDEEVRRRAQQCLKSLQQVPHPARTAAAARLLARRRPQGAAAALLAYLPSADWETVGEELLDALVTVGLEGAAKDAKPVPAVVAALADREAVRRAAAAHVLGHAAAESRRPLAPLLADPSPLVRYHAAAALTRAGDARGLPVLVALLGEGPAALAWSAEALLGRVAGEHAPPPVPGAPDDPGARKKWHAAWEGWWKAKGAKADLAGARLGEGSLGLIVTCEVDGIGKFPGRVSAFDRGGNLRWKVEGLVSPGDVQLLPSGRILVAEHWASRVTERDRSGKVLWERKLGAHAISAQRLRGGNTFIASRSELCEVTPGGREVFRYKSPGDVIYCACKLPNGRALFINGRGRVAELDAAGKEVLSFTPERYAHGASSWASIEPLRGGRYLICLAGTNRVVETDAAGKIHWECSVRSPCHASRLRNGHTLVANVDDRCVVEVDARGKEIWRKATKGRPFRARRY